MVHEKTDDTTDAKVDTKDAAKKDEKVKDSKEDKRKKKFPSAAASTTKPKPDEAKPEKDATPSPASSSAVHPAHPSPSGQAPAPAPSPSASASDGDKPSKRKKRTSEKKSSKKVFVARGKRKRSIARATIQEGKGVIRINDQNLASLPNPYIREIIREPIRYLGAEATGVDIDITVTGGGTTGQAQAARTAIANALVMYFDGANLKEKFNSIDTSLLIEDTRRVESKKYRGPKARARYQKSYR